MTRIFKTKPFIRFADKTGINDTDLQEAINDAENGLIDADLGGGVIKQRIACHNKGKSGGFRTIILFKKAERAFFIRGFAKNNQANISDSELAEIKKLAPLLLGLDNTELDKLINNSKITEIL